MLMRSCLKFYTALAQLRRKMPFVQKLHRNSELSCTRPRKLSSIEQPVLLELVLQSASANSQRFGVFFPVAGDVGQRLPDEHLLHLRQRCARPDSERGGI